MSEHLRSPHSMKREVSADGGRLTRTLVDLWPYIWPSDRPDLQRRVLWSLGLLVAANPPPLAGPVTFKFSTPRPPHWQDAARKSLIPRVIAGPPLMTAGARGRR